MFRSLFEPVPRWDMDRAREFIDSRDPGQYNLVDVRQPEEYAEEHIPGATLIPLGELPERVGELDPGKPTLVYCRSGGRAGNGTVVLTRAGFDQAHNIGGITEWNGLKASGAPEAGMAVFDAARSPAEYVALAAALEEGARLFYADVSERFAAHGQLFSDMAVGEQHHRDRLTRLLDELPGGDEAPSTEGVRMMEGGVDLDRALAWARDSEAADVLEFAAAMEANAHDRYILVGRAVGGETERAFLELAGAEKEHMQQLLRAFQQQLGS